MGVKAQIRTQSNSTSKNMKPSISKACNCGNIDLFCPNLRFISLLKMLICTNFFTQQEFSFYSVLQNA